MAESRSVWLRGSGFIGLMALTIPLACSSSGGTMKTPEGYRTPPLPGARVAVEPNGHVGAERGVAPQLSAREAEQLAASAYIYAYPLILMDTTRRVMTAVPRPDVQSLRAPLNQVVSAQAFPDPKLTTVVRPNFDTFYTSAWLDLSAEPVVLSVPDMGERYYLMPLMDLWTNVFATPGSRTTRESKADYVVTGPDFRGTVPEGMRQIKAPTRYVWLVGRIATKPGADEKAVRELESQLTVAPLSRFEDTTWRTLAVAVDRNVDTKTKPPEQVAKMTPQRFFDRFAELTRDNPPKLADQPLLQQLARLGVVPGKRFEMLSLSPELQRAVLRGMSRGQKTIEAKAQEGEAKPGWRSLGSDLGQYGTNYMNRAVVAFGGLGANLAADAVYPSVSTDVSGRPLEGSHRYRIRFREAPPAKAFWSLTVYDENGYVTKNALGRYSIGSQHELSREPDGSTIILLQPERPSDVRQQANWLPTPRGESFNVTLRMYEPERSAADGTWTPPSVERVE